MPVIAAFFPQVPGVPVDPWGKRSLGKGSVSSDFCPVVEKMLDVHPRRVTHAPYYAESFLTKTLVGLLLARATRNIRVSVKLHEFAMFLNFSAGVQTTKKIASDKCQDCNVSV